MLCNSKIPKKMFIIIAFLAVSLLALGIHLLLNVSGIDFRLIFNKK